MIIEYLKKVFKPVPLPKPTTLKGVVDDILIHLSAEDREYLRLDKHVGHFVGMSIRNKYDMWQPNSPVRQDAIKNYKISHADDISGVVLDWVQAILQGKSYNPQTTIARYEAHWKRDGFNNALEAGMLEGEA